MEKMTPQRLEAMLIAADIAPAAMSVMIGRDKDYIRDFIKGRKKTLKADELAEILSILRPKIDEELPKITAPSDDEMEVVGKVQAGLWLETYMTDEGERETIPVARDPRFPEATQYAVKVVGDSMDEETPDGSYAICVNFAESGLEQKPGMIVHVERIRPDQSEATLKAIDIEDGRLVLKPRSRNPVYKPILPDQMKGENVVIRGVVLSFFNKKLL